MVLNGDEVFIQNGIEDNSLHGIMLQVRPLMSMISTVGGQKV